MSLTSRFTTFFLVALALVLVAFSTALYVIGRVYFEHELETRMAGSLAVLAAAAELHPDGVEWEPQERVLSLGLETGTDRMRWVVFDEQGRRLDQSRNLDERDLTDRWSPQAGSTSLPEVLTDRQDRTWRVAQRRVGSGLAFPGERQPDRPHPEILHKSLTLTVFAFRGPMESTLATLAWFLVALVVAFWLLAALLCRRLSKRALAPLARMVESARGLDASDPGWSLEQAGTSDELDDLGQAFNDLLSRLHLAFERHRRFGGDASHQLRTPLTVLIGQVEVALRQDRSPEEYRRVLRSALGRATQLGQIVEALLFLARAEGEARLPAGERIDLNRWTIDHLAERILAHPDSRIVHRPADGVTIPVVAHSPLLGQLLDNLLDNASKHGQPGHPVQVETGLDGPFAVLSVEDDGSGIPVDDLPHVFEPFYRSSRARRDGIAGVGLGLAVVQRIAQAFGGSVIVLSEPARGCRVEVRLPTVVEDSLEARSDPVGMALDLPITDRPWIDIPP